ncbi:putative reverse transcriptase domain-containing protein [Tanacetum coccineum]
MDFITKLPRTKSGHDTIWLVVDRLTKSAHFLAIREDYSMEKLARLYIDEIVTWHGVLDVHLPSAEFSYNNSYHSSIRCASFEALYGRKCRSPVLWAEIGENRFIRPELVQEMTNKVVLIKEKLKLVRDHQKSYADNRRKPLEFEVGDQVLLKIVTTSRYVVPNGRVKVPAGRYVVPTGKDNVIVSAGRTKVIPASSTILVLCDMLSVIHTDQMHQPWRTFADIINRCISGKTTGLNRLKESQA